MLHYDKEDVDARKKLAENMYLAGMSLTDIAAHPDIKRSVGLMHQWKVKGSWEDTRAFQLAKSRGTPLAVKPSTQAKLDKILGSIDIDFDSMEPLTSDEAEVLATVTIKLLFKQLLIDIAENKVSYKSPNQVHDLLFGFLKEIKLAKGHPTEIREERLILPEDDVEAIKQGLRRLKALADRRIDIDVDL